MEAVREIRMSRRYLWLPVDERAPKQTVTISQGDTAIRQFEIRMADGEPEYWVFTDLEAWTGQTVTIAAERGDERTLARIAQRDNLPGGEETYREVHRPGFHFSSRRGWLNDPNGLLYHKGEYHLFYQHNPYGWEWGNMHWGHAVSRDLVHWKERGIALYPDESGTMWSGSGVVDLMNTSGFQLGEEPPLVLIYTTAGDTSPQSKGKPFTQCLAYSLDGGRTWSKYGGNPVIPEIAPQNRDPKVVWDDAARRWLMALYTEQDTFALWASPDLKKWESVGTVVMPGCAECPDMFEVPVEGRSGGRKWVFWSATRGAYLVGRLEEGCFVPESEMRYSLADGAHGYAAQTWSGIPQEDGRCIQIAWFNLQVPGMPFNGFMTFPCELTLRSTKEGLSLFFNPVREIASLREKRHAWRSIVLRDEVVPIAVAGELLDLEAAFEIGSSKEIAIHVHGVSVTYDVSRNVLSCNGVAQPLSPEEGRVKLRLLVDRTSIEIFGNDGAAYMPIGVIREQADIGLDIFARGGEAVLTSLVIHELRDIWG